jgi:hypothetical protein
MGVDPPTDDLEWSFFLGLAASCIFEERPGLASLFDNSELDDPGYISTVSGEYGVIERLLVASESW